MIIMIIPGVFFLATKYMPETWRMPYYYHNCVEMLPISVFTLLIVPKQSPFLRVSGAALRMYEITF